ncbi:hypothetical protein MK489_20145 [Myxococcota bacterium]|nr:hypothetical protein [Myxococcota bacterium]
MGVFLGAALVWGLHARSYLPFLSDDALISLRYAQRLLDGFGLTWTEGPRVEGYSNLLWVLAAAGLGSLGVGLIEALRWLGVLGALATLAAVLRAARPTGVSDLLPALGASGLLALSGSMGAWTVGGLEQPLLAALLAWGLVGVYPLLEPPRLESAREVARRALAPALALGLLCWTRPDGVLFPAAVCLAMMSLSELGRVRWAAILTIGTSSAVFVALQTAFRLSYYGAWVPNTANAKLAFSISRAFEGLVYLASGLGEHFPMVLLAGCLATLALGDAVSARRLRVIGVCLGVWCGYVIAVGGDTFPAYRHLVGVVVLLSLACVEGLRAALHRWAERPWLPWLATLAALGGLAGLQANSFENQRAREETWEWDGEVVGRLLARAFGEQRPLIAVDPSGTLPFFSGLPAVDMLGLNDRYLGEHPPPDLGRGWLGHELGDGDYVLSRQPDLVLFCTPAGGATPCFRSGLELVRDPRFAAEYRLLHLEGDDPHVFRTRIWARRDGRLGWVRAEDHIQVPAYWLSANPDSVARLDPWGAWFVAVDTTTSAGIRDLELLPGAARWLLSVQADGGPWEIVARPAQGGAWEARGRGGSLTFEVSSSQAQGIDVSLVALDPGQAVRVWGLELVREPLGPAPD